MAPRSPEKITAKSARRKAPAAPLRQAGRSSSLPASAIPALLAATGFLGTLAALAYQGRLPAGVPFLYVGASLFTLGTYKRDKTQAQKGDWRTPESTLHLLAAAGGWPGALIAQQLFRHKTRKMPFQAIFWATVLGHLAFWAWYFFR